MRKLLVVVVWLLVTCVATAQDKEEINEKLREELLKMKAADQEMHIKAVKDGGQDKEIFKQLRDLNKKHATRLKAIVKEHGWPTPKLVGDDGATAAYVIIQHADHDRPFQKQCLKLMKEKAEANEMTYVFYASLTDFVRFHENKKQLYGTLFKSDKNGKAVLDKNGDPVTHPIEDEKNVDKRREELGLMSLDEHKRLFKESFMPPKK